MCETRSEGKHIAPWMYQDVAFSYGKTSFDRKYIDRDAGGMSTKRWLVHENKTWEKAFQHCRAHNSYLVIVDTRRLQNLLKTATKHAQTISVWTSLRFLDGTWLWVNGVPLESQVSLSQCPKHPYRCGAYNFETDIWENKDCNEKLYFLCYG
ncbi:Asialoglycoprotein receptor 2 [Bagarius yarrelli]|uniref:Asialoglycoprotein receptor 2 n=1 Tax=Bagarius yarrelli TaxID=175774 RepID=A0A556U4D4_BAGYA|nr:Asialoglycoprotein receptor 2 [Bagarius yarrelli]